MTDYDRIRILLNDAKGEVFTDTYIDNFMQILIRHQNAQLCFMTAALISYSNGLTEFGDRLWRMSPLEQVKLQEELPK